MDRRTRTPGHGTQSRLQGREEAAAPRTLTLVLPDRMKQKEAGLRKKATPLLSAMAMQMEPMAIMVRLRSARMAAAKFRAAGETRREIIFDQRKQQTQNLYSTGLEFQFNVT